MRQGMHHNFMLEVLPHRKQCRKSRFVDGVFRHLHHVPDATVVDVIVLYPSEHCRVMPTTPRNLRQDILARELMNTLSLKGRPVKVNNSDALMENVVKVNHGADRHHFAKGCFSGRP